MEHCALYILIATLCLQSVWATAGKPDTQHDDIRLEKLNSLRNPPARDDASDSSDDRSEYQRTIDSLGGGYLLRSVGPQERGHFHLKYPRTLDNLGGGNLLRSLDSLGGGNLLAARAVANSNRQFRGSDPLGQFLRGAYGYGNVRQSRAGLDSLSGVTFGGNKRFDSLSGAAFGYPHAKRNFDEIDRSGIDSFVKRNFDEIDRTGFGQFVKRNFDEIDRTGFDSFVKREAPAPSKNKNQ